MHRVDTHKESRVSWNCFLQKRAAEPSLKVARNGTRMNKALGIGDLRSPPSILATGKMKTGPLPRHCSRQPNGMERANLQRAWIRRGATCYTPAWGPCSVMGAVLLAQLLNVSWPQFPGLRNRASHPGVLRGFNAAPAGDNCSAADVRPALSQNSRHQAPR